MYTVQCYIFTGTVFKLIIKAKFSQSIRFFNIHVHTSKINLKSEVLVNSAYIRRGRDAFMWIQLRFLPQHQK